MKYTRITALAAIGVAATLSLTACGSDSSGKASSSKSSSSSSSSTPDSGSKSESGSEAGNAKSSSGEDTEAKAATNSATKTGAKVTFCKTEDLAIDATDAAPDENSGRIDITMINRGSTTCSATGFAGVDIKDADNTSNPIERGHAQPRITTLKPGDAAVFDLAYDIDNSGDSLASPTNILVTPPNETHTVSLKWPAGAGEIKGAYTDVKVYPTHTTN
ncbi:type IV secretory pathway TrbL component [Streptomyces sp. TE3672]